MNKEKVIHFSSSLNQSNSISSILAPEKCEPHLNSDRFDYIFTKMKKISFTLFLSVSELLLFLMFRSHCQ